MIVDWFRNLGHNNKNSDDDIVKLALILILEMTLVGKDDKTNILYWALELLDDLDAFNKFLWGSFLYDRTFNSLSTCLLGRDDKFKNKFSDKLKEKVDTLVKRKVERYNVYRFVTAFQVWAIEAIPKWVTLGYAVRVNNVTPRILNWQCTETPTFVEIQKTIFKFKNKQGNHIGYVWIIHYVSPDVDGCGGEDDVEDDDEDDVEDDVDDVNHDDIEGDHPTKTFKKLKSEERRKN
ncbi:hypothetical protein Dsin_019512 [Dipteronia sinensis]|uniref:DUF1985 domain-containing protein n=1 Tax=Dipteronia sinensis TaxID=43782 RepID=A0AAE0E342_9ROSI|nr:hypothetical protein Dsin_019512 [Dipteronia sinensis]